ncbi:MAG: amidohydrolase family protein [Bacteroidales bacterium]
MRRIAANYIFPVTTPPIKNGIIETDDDGTIIKVINPGENPREMQRMEFYNGVLVPGFINSHCHLELSALKNQITPGLSLKNFVKHVYQKRKKLSQKEIEYSVQEADREICRNGIVACADISNYSFSFPAKRDSDIFYYTFIEVFGRNIFSAHKNYKHALRLYKKLLKESGMKGNLTPHSSYSVIPWLFKRIFHLYQNSKPIFSFHHQECSRQDEERLRMTGKPMSTFFPRISNHLRQEKPGLTFGLSYFPEHARVFLVHNTFTDESDILNIETFLQDVYWVFCPNSNLYIENKLPNLSKFLPYEDHILIGTDSLASNTHLSILKEMITLQNNFPELSFELLLKWATLNGARALGIDDYAGALEKGKKPGINLLYNFDLLNWRMQEDTNVKRIL